MNILAIRFARLGDIVLMLPALSALKASFPDSRLTFLTGHRCAPVGEMCPFVDEVISIDRIAMRDGPALTAFANMRRLVSDIRRRQFDLVVDFHSFRETNLLTWFSGAKKRLGIKRFKAAYLPFCFNMPPVHEDKSIHVADMFLAVVRALGNGCPAERNLVVPRSTREWAARALSRTARVSIYVDSSGPDKTWPAERFARLAEFAAGTLQADVAILSGRDGNTAGQVQNLVGKSGQIKIFPGLPLAQMAALIESSQLLVSNDTGPMHFGPALGIPTLGLFSVGLPEHFRPTGPFDRFLRENPIEKISVDAVINSVEAMWATTADPNPRR